MVDMAFLTQLTGLTDKWFYRLHQGWGLSGSHQAGLQLPLAEKWAKSGYRSVLYSPARNF